MTLHQALLHLRELGPRKKVQGICGNIVSTGPFTEDDLLHHFIDWPEYSGRMKFPVSHPELSPRDAYMDTEDLWDVDTEYGRARWRLLDFLIERTAP